MAKGQDMQAVLCRQALTVSDVPKRWQLTSDYPSLKIGFNFIFETKREMHILEIVKEMCRNSPFIEITLATTICGEGDF